MKIFLSWSGDVSRNVAEALRDWLPNVLQAAQPWMSSEDIHKGSRWTAEMAGQLAEIKAGVVCLTRENLRAPWLHYEAGALSRTIDKTMVCPYLFGIKPTDVTGPLIQFQASESNRKDTLALTRTLNSALGSTKLLDKQLDRAYERWWPDLDETLRSITAHAAAPKAPVRNDREMLEEILTLIRALFSSGPALPLGKAASPGGGPAGPAGATMVVRSQAEDFLMRLPARQRDRLLAIQKGGMTAANELGEDVVTELLRTTDKLKGAPGTRKVQRSS